MSDSLEILASNNKHEPCSEGEHCKSSPSNTAFPLCEYCRLSPYYGPKPYGMLRPVEHRWKPISSKFKHPTLEAEKRDAKRKKAIERQKARQAKDPTRQARSRAAARAESVTERAVIRSTKNSGRINRDGDHVLYESVVLDTKLQSKAKEPVVHFQELDKVRNDAKRNNYIAGGLVIRTGSGRGVAVFAEEDLGQLLQGLRQTCQEDAG